MVAQQMLKISLPKSRSPPQGESNLKRSIQPEAHSMMPNSLTATAIPNIMPIADDSKPTCLRDGRLAVD